MKGNCNTAQSYGAGQPQIKKVNYSLAMGPHREVHGSPYS